jgi:hypothetical protein
MAFFRLYHIDSGKTLAYYEASCEWDAFEHLKLTLRPDLDHYDAGAQELTEEAARIGAARESMKLRSAADLEAWRRENRRARAELSEGMEDYMHLLD